MEYFVQTFSLISQKFDSLHRMVNFVAKFRFDRGYCELKQINHLILQLRLYFKSQYIRANVITKSVEVIKGFQLILFDYICIKIVVFANFRFINIGFFF